MSRRLRRRYQGRAGFAGASVCTDRSTGRRSGGRLVTEPAPRTLDVRVGSSTDALTPVSVAGALARRTGLAVGGPRRGGDRGDRGRPADEADRLDRSSRSTSAFTIVGPFSIHHVQNSGIAFGLFASATPVVTALTAIAVGWMLVFFARSGARHPSLPVALGLLIGGSDLEPRSTGSASGT